MELQSQYITQPVDSQDVYENYDNNNQQEIYTNVPDTQEPYLELENDLPQEEYSDIKEEEAKPELLPRKSDKTIQSNQEIYENADISYESQKKKKDKSSKYKKSEPRYTSGPVKPPEPDTVVYVNQSEAKKSSINAKKKKPQEEPKTDTTTPLPRKSTRKSFSLPISTRLRTRYIVIILLIIGVVILLLLVIFFLAGWYGRGETKSDAHPVSDSCIFQQPELDPALVWCGEKEIKMISSIQSGTSLSDSDKTTLINMAQAGVLIRIAYQRVLDQNNSIWIYADSNQIAPIKTGEICVQLYETYTTLDLLGQETSVALEWTSVCTDGVINGVVYAIGTGKPVKAYQYKSQVKWFIHNQNKMDVYNDLTGMTSSYNKSILKNYISSGNDISVRYGSVRDVPNGLTGYLSANVITSSVNNITTAQFMDLSINNCSDTCYFNYQKDNSLNDYILWMQPSTIPSLNWDIMRYTVETHNSREHIPVFLNSTWSVDHCWTSVYENKYSASENDQTLKILLNAVRLGHRVRAVIQDNLNSFVNLEPSLLIIKNNQLYGVHISKAKINDTDKTKIDSEGMWEWTIISTNGKYIAQYCSIGNKNCLDPKSLAIKSVKWSIDSYKWTPIYQRQIPNLEATCGDTKNLINNVLAGKVIKYSITDLETNEEYFHQSHHVHLKDRTDVIIEHMNEVLLQWDQNGDIQFSPMPTMIYRQLSSTGNMLEQMWLYGSDRPVTSAGYNYLSGNMYKITWFA